MEDGSGERGLETETEETRVQESLEREKQRNPTSLDDDLPNGGMLAWLQVVGSFFLFFNSWGII